MAATQKNELFDPGFLFTPSDTFSLGRTVLPQYKTLQTTDRQTTHCTKGSTDSTVGQKEKQVNRKGSQTQIIQIIHIHAYVVLNTTSESTALNLLIYLLWPGACTGLVNEDSMRSGHWLRLVLCGPFRALTMMVRLQEGHPIEMLCAIYVLVCLSLAICLGCTVASGIVSVVVVVGVCNCSQMRTSKCTCLIFGVSVGLDPG